jgi:nitrite transporter NirC
VPTSIPDTLHANLAAGRTKSDQARDLPRYLFAAALAGAFVGVAVVLLLSVGAPLVAAGSPLAKLAMGSVFGVALTLVVFAGGELVTGNMMVMTQTALGRRVSWSRAALVCGAALVGNFIGSLALALAVHGSGTFASGPGAELVAATVAGKDALSGPQLFWRAVLCNALVCLGLWMAARATSDTAKLIVLWWALLAFIASGFEHSVANMTTFAIAALSGSGDWSMLARNLLWTVPGNLVGGALLVGAGYAWLGQERPASAPHEAATAAVVTGQDRHPVPAERTSPQPTALAETLGVRA